jgi:membrane protease YdiL (CAAX protease family)
LPTTEYDSINQQQDEAPQLLPAPPAIAPVWHTIVLVVGILALSIQGAHRLSAEHGPIDRLSTYGFSAAMEALMLAWVIFGLRLTKLPLRSLLGSFSFSVRSIVADLGFAAIFWIASMTVLGTLSIAWAGVEVALSHRAAATQVAGQAGQSPFSPDPSRLEAIRELAQLAPANGREIAAWTMLCLLVGFVEEIVFRGYLQRQFIGWARGGVGLGVTASALVFGGAHAYQGARSMTLLAVFGVLFSMLALYRRSLRAGIFAHAWHDLIAGLALALLRSSHIL